MIYYAYLLKWKLGKLNGKSLIFFIWKKWCLWIEMGPTDSRLKGPSLSMDDSIFMCTCVHMNAHESSKIITWDSIFMCDFKFTHENRTFCQQKFSRANQRRRYKKSKHCIWLVTHENRMILIENTNFMCDFFFF